MYTATKIPFMYSSSGTCCALSPSPVIRIFLMYAETKIPFMFSSSGNCTLPGEVVEPGTAHGLQPYNQDSYIATKFPFMYSSSGNCTGCQERSWNQVPSMISSPAIRIFFFYAHCNENPIYVFLFWKLRA
jgi:hypothetical protein